MDRPFACEVIADNSGEWCGNALTFPTIDAAVAYADDLFHRWTAVRTWRVVQLFVSWGGFVVRVPVKEKP